MKKYPISIIIPVYKNYQMFYEYFEINKKYFSGCQVIVLNDYPEENITKPVRKIYPEAVVVNNKKNLGFASNVNQGVAMAKGAFVLLINSDVVLKDDSFIKSLDYFKKDKALFAVGFAQIEQGGKIVGANRGYFKDGLIYHSHLPIHNFLPNFFNFWAEGGASLFKKKIFVDLGMFDSLYNPFYWEDVDLSYRAWKSGYKILFDTTIHLKHNHESTIGKYYRDGHISKIAFRNQIIFQWKNLTDRDFILNHLANIPRFIFTPGFFSALFLLPKILKSRKKVVKLFKKTDREILNYFQ